MEYNFLTERQVIKLHGHQIEMHGGEPGLRDMNLLQSALYMPTATFEDIYLHTDIFEMAGAYMFHLVKNHPFIDGNKRTGALAAIVFLKINGIEFDGTNEDLADFVLSLASGEKDKSEAALFLKQHSKAL